MCMLSFLILIVAISPIAADGASVITSPVSINSSTPMDLIVSVKDVTAGGAAALVSARNGVDVSVGIVINGFALDADVSGVQPFFFEFANMSGVMLIQARYQLISFSGRLPPQSKLIIQDVLLAGGQENESLRTGLSAFVVADLRLDDFASLTIMNVSVPDSTGISTFLYIRSNTSKSGYSPLAMSNRATVEVSSNNVNLTTNGANVSFVTVSTNDTTWPTSMTNSTLNVSRNAFRWGPNMTSMTSGPMVTFMSLLSGGNSIGVQSDSASMIVVSDNDVVMAAEVLATRSNFGTQLSFLLCTNCWIELNFASTFVISGNHYLASLRGFQTSLARFILLGGADVFNNQLRLQSDALLDINSNNVQLNARQTWSVSTCFFITVLQLDVVILSASWTTTNNTFTASSVSAQNDTLLVVPDSAHSQSVAIFWQNTAVLLEGGRFSFSENILDITCVGPSQQLVIFFMATGAPLAVSKPKRAAASSFHVHRNAISLLANSTLVGAVTSEVYASTMGFFLLGASTWSSSGGSVIQVQDNHANLTSESVAAFRANLSITSQCFWFAVRTNANWNATGSGTEIAVSNNTAKLQSKSNGAAVSMSGFSSSISLTSVNGAIIRISDNVVEELLTTLTSSAQPSTLSFVTASSDTLVFVVNEAGKIVVANNIVTMDCSALAPLTTGFMMSVTFAINGSGAEIDVSNNTWDVLKDSTSTTLNGTFLSFSRTSTASISATTCIQNASRLHVSKNTASIGPSTQTIAFVSDDIRYAFIQFPSGQALSISNSGALVVEGNMLTILGNARSNTVLLQLVSFGGGLALQNAGILLITANNVTSSIHASFVTGWLFVVGDISGNSQFAEINIDMRSQLTVASNTFKVLVEGFPKVGIFILKVTNASTTHSSSMRVAENQMLVSQLQTSTVTSCTVDIVRIVGQQDSTVFRVSRSSLVDVSSNVLSIQKLVSSTNANLTCRVVFMQVLQLQQLQDSVLRVEQNQVNVVATTQKWSVGIVYHLSVAKVAWALSGSAVNVTGNTGVTTTLGVNLNLAVCKVGASTVLLQNASFQLWDNDLRAESDGISGEVFLFRTLTSTFTGDAHSSVDVVLNTFVAALSSFGGDRTVFAVILIAVGNVLIRNNKFVLTSWCSPGVCGAIYIGRSTDAVNESAELYRIVIDENVIAFNSTTQTNSANTFAVQVRYPTFQPQVILANNMVMLHYTSSLTQATLDCSDACIMTMTVNSAVVNLPILPPYATTAPRVIAERNRFVVTNYTFQVNSFAAFGFLFLPVTGNASPLVGIKSQFNSVDVTFIEGSDFFIINVHRVQVVGSLAVELDLCRNIVLGHGCSSASCTEMGTPHNSTPTINSSCPTRTQTSSIAVANTVSAPSTRVTLSPTASPSMSDSKTVDRRCPVNNPARTCELFSSATDASRAVDVSLSVMNGTGCEDRPAIPRIAYARWSGGDSVEVAYFFSPRVTAWGLLGPVLSPTYTSTGSSGGEVEYALVRVGGNRSISYVVVSVRYVGTASLTGTAFTVRIPLKDVLSCTANVSDAAASTAQNGTNAVVLVLAAELEAAPQVPGNVGTVVTTGVGVAVVASVAVGVPSGLVQSGIANTLGEMLRCAVFDPEDEVDTISNPPMWGTGRPELQYQRGSLVIVLVLMSVWGTLCCLVVCAFKAGGLGGGTWGGAVDLARLPSLMLVVVMFFEEMSVPPLINVLLYRNSDAIDYLLAVAVGSPIVGYLALYAHRSSWGIQVTVEEYRESPISGNDTQHDDDNESLLARSGSSSDEDDGRGETRQPRWRRFLIFVLEPTHGPTIRVDEGDEVLYQATGVERWVRRNFYFIADKRWPAFGALEACVGATVDFLQGIPLSSRNAAVCIARPAAMCVLLVILLFVLLWKKPHAVRLQQWSGVCVTGMLVCANILVVANVAIPSEQLEAVAGWLVGATSLVIVALGLLDLMSTILLLFPMLRKALGVEGRTLDRALRRMRVLALRVPRLLDHIPEAAESTDVSRHKSRMLESLSDLELLEVPAETANRGANTNAPSSDDDGEQADDKQVVTPQKTPFGVQSKDSGTNGVLRGLGNAAEFERELREQETARRNAMSQADRDRLENREWMEAVLDGL